MITKAIFLLMLINFYVFFLKKKNISYSVFYTTFKFNH